ncbi:hypothetical protein ACOMHN_003369 [Nucella lapillus]
MKRLRGRGKARGKGKGRGKSTQKDTRPRSRSHIDSGSSLDDTECGRCGQAGGENWIQCDICGLWYDLRCTDLTGSLEDMEAKKSGCAISAPSEPGAYCPRGGCLMPPKAANM